MIRPDKILWAFWSEIFVAVLAILLWPFIAIRNRARRERWSDPR